VEYYAELCFSLLRQGAGLMQEIYSYGIVALLPLTTLIVVWQKNPYNALVLRGVLGAVSTLVYAVLGAADVALTEALMGTMLAVTLYAVAMRSSLVVRVGVLNDDEQTIAEIRCKLSAVFQPYHLLVEVNRYADYDSLHGAIASKEIHAIHWENSIQTRVPRLYEIMQKNSPINSQLLEGAQS
jgi:putative multicomponent Na+:H+ antiporter subunit B